MSLRMSTTAPLCSRASRGPVSSTCSKPSVTRKATRLPFSSALMGLAPFLDEYEKEARMVQVKFRRNDSVVGPFPLWRVRIGGPKRVCTYVPRTQRRTDPASLARHHHPAAAADHGRPAVRAVHA
ncbi:protein of unknown function [Pseudomonas sp. JV551A1]|nr:protein of unknown function [Pseudomonas sp. JV551A1]